jgi:integrase
MGERAVHRGKDLNKRIRDLEAELNRQRIAREAETARTNTELESLRRQAAARRAPVPLYLGKLTQTEVNNKIRQRKFGHYSDGGNLQLSINPGAKPDSKVIASWLFRWTEMLGPKPPRSRKSTRATQPYREAKSHSMGLGSARDVSLDDARGLAQQYRQVLRDGNDPKVERLNMLCAKQAAKDRLRTLEQVAEEYIKAKLSKKPGWAIRVRQLLRDNILNKQHQLSTSEMIKVGTMPIQRVTRQIILKDCGFEELWNEHNPSADNLRGVLDNMYDFAREHDYYVGNSPMAWRGGLEHVLPASKEVHTTKHHPSLTWENAPTFLQQHLRKHQYGRSWPIGIAPDGQPINAKMVELALMTGTRIGEIVQAEWQQIDDRTMTFTVPWDRTKRHEPGKDHRMPITTSMAAIFEVMRKMRTDPSPNAPIFPSHHKRWVESHRRVASQTLNRLVRQLAPEMDQEFVTHGFRSTLRDWCRANDYPEYLWRLQVHHKEKNQSDGAYGPDDQLEKRRIMMQHYDNYLNTAPPAKQVDNIVNMTSRKRRTA